MSERTVLVVDDEFAIRDMLRMALEIAEYRCIEAENIQQAHALVVDERPDIILLDWMLPGGSGLELLRRLKREESTREVPVIMLTAKTAEDNVIQGLDVGADDYITKPFAPRELIARVRALLRRTGGGEEQGRMEVSGLVLDGESRRIFVGEEPLIWALPSSTCCSFLCPTPSGRIPAANCSTMYGVPTSTSRSARLMCTFDACARHCKRRRQITVA